MSVEGPDFTSYNSWPSKGSMPIPVFAGQAKYPHVWYVDGSGFIDEQGQEFDPPEDFLTTRMAEAMSVIDELDELSHWREVRMRLSMGEDIMDIPVPHESMFGDPYTSFRKQDVIRQQFDADADFA